MWRGSDFLGELEEASEQAGGGQQVGRGRAREAGAPRVGALVPRGARRDDAQRYPKGPRRPAG
jgi:hypothetical protein